MVVRAKFISSIMYARDQSHTLVRAIITPMGMGIVPLAVVSRVGTHPGVPSWGHSGSDSSSCATVSIALGNLSFFSSLLPCFFLASHFIGAKHSASVFETWARTWRHYRDSIIGCDRG